MRAASCLTCSQGVQAALERFRDRQAGGFSNLPQSCLGLLVQSDCAASHGFLLCNTIVLHETRPVNSLRRCLGQADQAGRWIKGAYAAVPPFENSKSDCVREVYNFQPSFVVCP